ncbi:DsbA family protein [Hyphomicrobium sp. NDB2Meth4]|uniref:DsbA family protein n=1 Tax=Hyphomicrobium sp. NDB2Meth4 TaxID=1892846 RepID=UPI0009F978FC|nr:DsbA family protein [Hyphomicrobium sp. NDB2Meth4]
MSANSRPSLLRTLTEQRATWLVIPAVALLGALVLLGNFAATPQKVSEAVAAEATAPAGPASPVKVAEAPTPPPVNFTPEQKKELEKIIKNYLINNPEVFLEAQSALEAKMEKEQAEKLKTAIAENARDIYRDPVADVAGNPDGDITVVEFFDYNCGYCKRGLHDVIKLVESDPKVRVVFKELPILSKGSEEASRVAIAAGRQGKYWDMHKAMLEAKGVMNEANALAIASKLGLDIEKLKKDMASADVEAEIKKSEALAKKMGVNGTPHFLVGDRSIPGAPEDLYDQLEKHVTELRKSGCSYC